MTSGRSVSCWMSVTALLGLVGQRRAHVDVEGHGAPGDLLLHVDRDARQVALA